MHPGRRGPRLQSNPGISPLSFSEIFSTIVRLAAKGALTARSLMISGHESLRGVAGQTDMATSIIRSSMFGGAPVWAKFNMACSTPR
jgi:hypothetical protein